MSSSASAFKRIVVPIDGSPPSDAAIALALTLAKAHGGEIAFCHSIDLAAIAGEASTPYGVSDLSPALDAMNEGAREILESAHARAGRAQILCSCTQLEGRAESAILRFADEWKADAIVMGTQGKRGLERFFLGSTAESVLRGARIPVVVVHGAKATAEPATMEANNRNAATVR